MLQAAKQDVQAFLQARQGSTAASGLGSDATAAEASPRGLALKESRQQRTATERQASSAAASCSLKQHHA